MRNSSLNRQPSGFAAPVRCGAIAKPDGSIVWRVWAPRAQRVELVLIDGLERVEIAMEREERHYFVHVESDVKENQQYAYRLDGGQELPDPCSLWQPASVHGPSAVVCPHRFRWTDQGWKGVRRQDLVIYELHVGTFAREGTFDAIVPRLAALRELGITAIELMPIAQFPGGRNWGYDGVGLFAAQNSYGGPLKLQKLVDACHNAGLAILLDVVYNHLGPEGNYLAQFGPYFSDRYRTPWGDAVNYDSAGSGSVRDFVKSNAQMWLDQFHFDGLRIDAIHAIYDFSAKHILREIQELADEIERSSGRNLHIIAESDLNDPRILHSPENGGHALDAQWADDFHHAVHAWLTGETRGYYSDFGRPDQITRALQSPFVYAGDYSQHRDRNHGASAAGLSGDRFVVAIQNHDQIGNRARGDRLITLFDNPAKQRLATSLLFLSPYVPLLFMGEEYGEDRPFPFFCSFGDENLVQAVREGRKREFADFAFEGDVPDPNSEETFSSAVLSWSWPENSPRAKLRLLYGDLLSARREWPALRDYDNRSARVLPDAVNGPLLEMRRGKKESSVELLALFNLGDGRQPLPFPIEGKKVIYSSESSRYGGERKALGAIVDLLPYECVVFGPT